MKTDIGDISEKQHNIFGKVRRQKIVGSIVKSMMKGDAEIAFRINKKFQGCGSTFKVMLEFDKD